MKGDPLVSIRTWGRRICVCSLLSAASLATMGQECRIQRGLAPVLVYGQLTDPSGAAVTDTSVSLSCGQDHTEARTDKAGRYTLRVSPGDWNFRVIASGFASVTQAVSVAEGNDLQLNVPLHLSSSDQQISVQAGSDGYVTQDSELGTHTNTSIMNIPQAVYVIPESVLRDQQVVRLSDATRNVSGVAFADDGGGRNENLVIRGFTSGVLFKDGFRNDNNSTRSYAELSNVEKVEILKGPSSTVFGRLDPSGVVNLVTKQPLSRPQISVQMQGGSYQFLRPTVDATGPLLRSGKLLGRFVASGQDSQSYRNFVAQHRLFLSPTLTWTPTRSTSVRFYSEFLGGSNQPDRGLIALGTRPANLPITRYLADPTMQSPYREGKAGLSVDQVLGHGMLFRSYERSSTGYSLYNARIANTLLANNTTIRLNDLISDQYFQTHYWINELTGKAKTGFLEHTLLGGIELNYELFDTKTLRATNSSQLTLNIYNPNYAALPSRQLALNRINQTRNGYGGGYVQDQIRLTPRLLVTAGIRYDIAKMKTVGYYSTPNSSSRNTAWSPRLGVTYRVIDAISLYATWSRSFQPQSGLSAANVPFSPERGKLLETGMKYDAMAHRIAGTVSIYQIDKTNVLTTDPNDTSYQIQVGAQRSRGIEWNQTTRLNRGLSLISGYAFNQAQVSKDTVYVIGTGLVAAPRHTGNMWVQYQPEQGWLRRSSWGAGLFGASKSEGQLRTQSDPGTYFLLPGYVRFDMGASYNLVRSSRWNYRFAVNANNVLDRRYFAGSGGRFAVYPGSPRNLVFSLQMLRIGESR